MLKQSSRRWPSAAQRTGIERHLPRDEWRICHDVWVAERNTESIESYVRAALTLQGYQLDEAQIAQVTLEFSRIEAIAQLILRWPLPFTAEAAPAFRP
jgi:Protein of unknown function (DUF4089)